ncbi:MAG TPA: AAA family ATPase [Gemmataceae bacterium]|nr:AAA family ATPase [Gemmataceae bacterium]
MSTVPKKDANVDLEEPTKLPFLRRVRIRGYKSIAFCDVSLQPLTIFVGRNASGKSNFLDALAFLRDAMKTSVSEAVNRRGGWSSVACRNPNTQKINFEIEVDFLSSDPQVATYRLELSTEGNVAPIIATESVEITDQATQFSASFLVRDGKIYDWKSKPESPGLIDIPHPRHLFSLYRDRLLLSVLGTPPFIDLWNGLRGMAFYNFIPEAMRRVQPPTSGQLLDQNGWNLASVLDSTRKNDDWAFMRIGSYLSAVVREVERFEAVRYGEFETIHFWLSFNGPDHKLDFDAANLSDGTLRALAALTAAFQNVLPYGYPSVVGIEEPETALHPAAMRALVDALDDATQRTQILVTTHSADLLDNPTIRPENVRVVEMIDGQTVIGPLDDASVEIVRQKLDTLGGLERQNQLEPDLDDRERQRLLADNGQEPK